MDRLIVSTDWIIFVLIFVDYLLHDKLNQEEYILQFYAIHHTFNDIGGRK